MSQPTTVKRCIFYWTFFGGTAGRWAALRGPDFGVGHKIVATGHRVVAHRGPDFEVGHQPAAQVPAKKSPVKVIIDHLRILIFE